MARRLGLGFDESSKSGTGDVTSEGPLLKQVKAAVQKLINQGYVPSPFWKPSPSQSPGSS